MTLEEYLATAVDAAKKAGEVFLFICFIQSPNHFFNFIWFCDDFQIIRKGFYLTKNIEHKGQVINPMPSLLFFPFGQNFLMYWRKCFFVNLSYFIFLTGLYNCMQILVSEGFHSDFKLWMKWLVINFGNDWSYEEVICSWDFSFIAMLLEIKISLEMLWDIWMVLLWTREVGRNGAEYEYWFTFLTIVLWWLWY